LGSDGARRRRVREPEPETIGQARAGDLRAFESLVRDYQADVWRFAYHLTRDRALAEDVTQEAFLKAYRAIDSYRGQAKFSSWLLRIVRNCAIDAYRKTRRETLVGDVADQSLERDLPAHRPSSSEDRMAIEDALRRLPMPLREPFVVIEVMGFNYREAAGILGMRIGTVKSRMHRARSLLIQALSEGEVADEM
jgi:RNA polymerase sigma-70 factor (ECF subfamily)